VVTSEVVKPSRYDNLTKVANIPKILAPIATNKTPLKTLFFSILFFSLQTYGFYTF
jgi:hypothetical protein